VIRILDINCGTQYLATELLRQGASLSEIGDVLGHRHPQTTMMYTKVDLEALRTLALPWPGGAQ
jgi:integrase/recombinase XerD